MNIYHKLYFLFVACLRIYFMCQFLKNYLKVVFGAECKKCANASLTYLVRMDQQGSCLCRKLPFTFSFPLIIRLRSHTTMWKYWGLISLFSFLAKEESSQPLELRVWLFVFRLRDSHCKSKKCLLVENKCSSDIKIMIGYWYSLCKRGEETSSSSASCSSLVLRLSYNFHSHIHLLN